MIKKQVNKLLIWAVCLCFTNSVFASGSAYWIYTVQKGDNLWSFSERHLISPAYALKLKLLNKITDPYNIRPNTKLKVPLEWGKQVESSATISDITGRVTVTFKGKAPTIATVGMSLPSGTHIATDKNAQLTLKFADGSFLILNSETAIMLGRQVYFPTTGATANIIDLEKGSLGGSIEHPPAMNNRYEIRTRTAVTAIRGTEFDVSADSIGATRMSVFSGNVELTAGGKDIAVDKGFGSLVSTEKSDAKTEKLLPAPEFRQFESQFADNLPVFSWNKVEGAVRYKVELYSAKEKTSLLQVKTAEINKILLPVESNGHYRIRVHAISEAGLLGLPVEGAFAVNGHPFPPIEYSPSNTDSQLSKQVALELGASDETEAYQIQISKDNNFQDDVETVKVGLDKPKILFPESGEWYWRVATISKDGQIGAYGPKNKIHIGTLSIRNLAQSTLRVRPVEFDNMTYRLDLYNPKGRKGEQKIIYTKTQSTPEWKLNRLSDSEYIAQITYLFNGKEVYQTPRQKLSR